MAIETGLVLREILAHQRIQHTLAATVGVIDSTIADLTAYLEGLERVRGRIIGIQQGSDNLSVEQLAAISAILADCMLHAGVNTAQLCLEINARVANIPLLAVEVAGSKAG